MKRSVPHSCLRLARAAAGMVALIGACGLAGWLMDSVALKALLPGGVNMKANTAIVLLILSAAVWLRTCPSSRSTEQLARGLALIAALVGSATLLEHLLDLDLGIDQLLFKEAVGATATASPGRMGPPAALSLGLSGWALVAAYSSRPAARFFYQATAITVAVVALIPLIGYAYGVQELYGISRYTGIAVHTAVALLFLAFGIFLARPQIGLMAFISANDAGGVMARRLIVPALLLPFLVGWLRWMADSAGVLEPSVTRPVGVLVLTLCTVSLILFNVRPLSLLDRERAQSERRLRTVTENAQILLANLDEAERHVFVNGNYARQFGRTAQGTLGAHLREVLGEELYARVQPHTRAALNGRTAEFELDRAGETERQWLHVIVTPEEDPDGTVRGVVVVMADVSARKQAELELEQKRDQAVAASKAKDEFIAMVSHELRTPLSPVLLLASEGAENTDWPDAVRSTFAKIRRQVEQEARLIDDLLDVSRMIQRKLPLQLGVIDATVVLDEAIAAMEAEAAAKRQKLVLNLYRGAVPLRADFFRLQQVFWNVLRNAVKFTPPDGTIHVVSAPGSDANTFQLTISDSGIGMTATELQRAFEPFSQGEHANRSHVFGGLGLGLAISKMLVDQHGGTITAQSDGRDRGTTVRIELPLHHTAEPAEPRPRTATVTRRPGDHSSLRVLVVEDHTATRDALVLLLKRRGFTVLQADSKAAALALAARETFDMLISDLGLPDGDGCELMAELRQTRSMVGIALTGYGMDGDMARTAAAGFAAHLTKPVSISALDQAIARLHRDSALATSTPPA